MKKSIVIISVLMLIFSTGCVKKEGVNKISELLPENSLCFLKLSSLETLFKNLSIKPDSVFGSRVDASTKLDAMLGFNPLSIDGLKNAGFDTGKDLGIALVGLSLESMETGPRVSGIIFIPVNDSKKIEKKIEELLAKFAPQKKLARDGDIFSIMPKEKGANTSFMFKDNYFLLAFGLKEDPKSLLETVGKTSLLNTDSYQKIASNIDSDKVLFLYANVKGFFDSNKAIFEMFKEKSKKHPRFFGLELFKGYVASGMSVDFEGSDLSFKSASVISPDSKILKVVEPVTYNKKAILGIKEKPVAFISFALNFKGYLEMLSGALPDEASEKMKVEMEMMKAKTKIDLEKELLENLAGNINFGIFDGATISMMNLNTILTINMKDEATMKNLMDKAIDIIPMAQRAMINKEKVEGIDSYVITGLVQLFAGIKDKNLIVTIGKSMYEKALKGSESSGFTSDLKDKRLIDAFRGEKSVFYFNIPELLKVYENLSGFITKDMSDEEKAKMEKVIETIGNVEYILATAGFTKKMDKREFVIKTNFKEPFFIGVKKIIESFKLQE